MADGNGASPFILPQMFDKPGNVLQNQIAYNERNKERQYEIDYRNRKDQEADDWRKINLIQDLTDLSKHQTGSDVANAIGSQHANEIFQKYVASASSLSPAELAGSIQKDMNGLITNMDGVKMELEQSDKQLAQLKQLYPELDVAQLTRDYRADVVGRHLKSANEFYNPYEVKQTSIDLSDPEFLSKYVSGNKNTSDEIINPKGADESTVFVGNPNSYTKFSAKIPYYKKANFSDDQLDNGFLKKGEPSLQFKTETLPSQSLPSSNGKPFEMVSQDVYKRFSENSKSNLELISTARNMFPNYDQFNSTEKEYAKRKALLDMMKGLDNSNYHPTEVHTPSASLIKLWSGQSGNGNSSKENYIDIWNEIQTKGAAKQHMIPLHELSSRAQTVLLQQARLLEGENDLSNADIFVGKQPDGTYTLMKQDKTHGDKFISPLDFLGVNVPGNNSLGVKAKREVVNNAPKTEQSKVQVSDWKSRAKKIN